jgi:hypothetical protein
MQEYVPLKTALKNFIEFGCASLQRTWGAKKQHMFTGIADRAQCLERKGEIAFKGETPDIFLLVKSDRLDLCWLVSRKVHDLLGSSLSKVRQTNCLNSFWDRT